MPSMKIHSKHTESPKHQGLMGIRVSCIGGYALVSRNLPKRTTSQEEQQQAGREVVCLTLLSQGHVPVYSWKKRVSVVSLVFCVFVPSRLCLIKETPKGILFWKSQSRG